MCEKCLYKANCQFLAKHRACKVESCTAFKSEKELKADTAKKMQERLIAEFRKDDRMNYYLRMTLDQITKEILEGV